MPHEPSVKFVASHHVKGLVKNNCIRNDSCSMKPLCQNEGTSGWRCLSALHMRIRAGDDWLEAWSPNLSVPSSNPGGGILNHFSLFKLLDPPIYNLTLIIPLICKWAPKLPEFIVWPRDFPIIINWVRVSGNYD
ncbi:hypothetical protein VNO77_08765 [Canavalia gladiata]|uniref:Uncharacterized protein n=1 Tax=Canavalia gladiata TaxID=3824 RepID=A0AAN9MA99_CANGL